MKEYIELSLISKAIIRGNKHLYCFIDAMSLVEICHQNNIKVLGIDSFLITETKTQPFLEHSIDFSGIEETYEAAKDFLEKKRDFGFVFEIVY